MLPNEPHRKLIHHYDQPGHAHELTFSCYQRLPLLHDDSRCRILSECIDRATAGQGFELVAFIYMPEHVHLVVFPITDDATISNLLFAIKKPCSFRIKKAMESRHDPLLDRLMIRERPGKQTFRFWQEGPGYDRNLMKVQSLHESIRYIHHNPVRRKLCQSPDGWKWSSWRHYNNPELNDADLPTVHGIPS